ncbi:MAG: DUF5681 domain-containing protein [Sphingomicrobium sp.]
MNGRFQKGQSGNPKGRPKARRPLVSAFDIVFDRTLTVSQNGVERELTVDEALQLKTYQAALKGSKMAVRAVLKMIEKREIALRAVAPERVNPSPVCVEYDSDSADQAMLILGILKEAEKRLGWSGDAQLKIDTWAAQAALSRPGRRNLSDKDIEDCKLMTIDPGKLRWPRGRA